jgi:hypothetical protein
MVMVITCKKLWTYTFRLMNLLSRLLLSIVGMHPTAPPVHASKSYVQNTDSHAFESILLFR